MEKKKRSVFQIFIIPLVFIVLAQSALTYGIINYSGTMESIAEYSIDTLRQTVENRKIILESNMVNHWSKVDEEAAALNSRLAELLAGSQITVDQFIGSPEYQKRFLEGAMSTNLYLLRKNGVSGSFLILAGPGAAGGNTALDGIYFRDTDPLVNPGDDSDVLMERGDSAFSRDQKIPLDTLWKNKFHFAGAGEREADNFFFEPYLAALGQPEIGYENLAYWSRPFCLEGNVEEDSYRMISYSAPLIYEGAVYGVIGVEISEKYLFQNMPDEELDRGGERGYLLLLDTPKEGLIPLAAQGTSMLRGLEAGERLTMSGTAFDGLYEMNGGQEGKGNAPFACVEALRLYNTNTPFSDQVWMLAGIRGGESLFGVRDDIRHHLVVSLMVALVFGLAGIYLTVRSVSDPIKILSECIRKSPENELGELAETGILEVDGLYRVVEDLTRQQKSAENRLIEEKERYRMALESSSDTMFTYDINTGRVDIMNLTGGTPGPMEEFFPHRQEGRTGVRIHPEDEAAVRRVFADIRDRAFIQLRARDSGEGSEYRWLEMSCKAIYDTDHNRTKVIGLARDIHEEKLKELELKEAQQRDYVSGLYSEAAGMRRVEEMMAQNRGGSLILMDIDRFRELNERFGMVFGDAIIEEIGRIVRETAARLSDGAGKIIALRAGGDELMIWAEGGAKRAGEAVRKIRDGIAASYRNCNMELKISCGVGVDESGTRKFSALFREACCAMNFSKHQGGGQTVFYPEMTKEQRELSSVRTPINEIASLAGSERLNMVSLVFNFFDKSGDIHTIIPVLLVKLGNRYRASDILVVEADPEFHTTYVSYRWHGGGTEEDFDGVRHFEGAQYGRMTAEIGGEDWRIRDIAEIEGEKRRLLFLPPGRSGLAAPMYDKGVFMGAMIYLTGEKNPCWKDAERSELAEITKLIETNINNQRYDLASKAKSDFLSRMSHEIRTPMNAIIGMTEIALQKREDPERVERCLKQIEQSSRFLLGLINDVLDMSKIESGKMQLDLGGFSLAELLTGVDDLLRPQIEAGGKRFLLDAPKEDLFLTGDRLRLNQVLVNLLGNAMKFTPAGGEIRLIVRARQEQDTVRVSFCVRDTGIGIKEEDMERIFRSFEQANSRPAVRYGGTGLGLTISSRFVRMMGGEITVRSEVGRGSEFCFEIPLQKGLPAPDPGVSGPGGDAPPDRVSFSGKRILIVEDNELNAEIASILLKDRKAEVEIAVNGKEAVDCFCGHEPGYYSLVLMDVRMPVMDGLAATRRIRGSGREDSARIPIIAMSANAFDEDMKKSVESGMNGHLAKPIDVPEFLGTIGRMIL